MAKKKQEEVKKGNKTTQQDFDFFVSVCKFWAQHLGLVKYDVKYIWEEIDNSRIITWADSWIDPQHGKVEIRLNKLWEEREITKEALEESGLHEVLHVLLQPVCSMAEQTFSSRLVSLEEHKIIHTLIPNLLKKIVHVDLATQKERDKSVFDNYIFTQDYRVIGKKGYSRVIFKDGPRS